MSSIPSKIYTTTTSVINTLGELSGVNPLLRAGRHYYNIETEKGYTNLKVGLLRISAIGAAAAIAYGLKVSYFSTPPVDPIILTAEDKAFNALDELVNDKNYIDACSSLSTLWDNNALSTGKYVFTNKLRVLEFLNENESTFQLMKQCSNEIHGFVTKALTTDDDPWSELSSEAVKIYENHYLNKETFEEARNLIRAKCDIIRDEVMGSTLYCLNSNTGAGVLHKTLSDMGQGFNKIDAKDSLSNELLSTIEVLKEFGDHENALRVLDDHIYWLVTSGHASLKCSSFEPLKEVLKGLEHLIKYNRGYKTAWSVTETILSGYPRSIDDFPEEVLKLVKEINENTSDRNLW